MNKEINSVENGENQKEQCPTCSGSGKTVSFHNTGSDYKQHYSKESVCPTCNGDGKVDAVEAAKIRKRNEFWEHVLTR